MDIYEKHVFKDVNLPFIINSFALEPERETYSCANWHENVEFLFVKDGQGRIRVDENIYDVKPKDIVIINKNRLHSVSPLTTLTYGYMIVDRSFCRENHFDTTQILFQEFINDEEIFHLLCEIAELRKKADQIKYLVQMIRAKVLYVMALLCEKYSREETQKENDMLLVSSIKRAIGFMHTEACTDISLEKLCAFAGFSKSYFSRKFKDITGYSPMNYLIMIRCDKAKMLLHNTDKSLAQISTECGFCDQSYFTKTFKKATGVTPTQYKTLLNSQKP